jgi:hypothetical protein
MSAQATFGGTGRNGLLIRASRRQADARPGSVPPVGAQRSVQEWLAPFGPCGQTVMCSEVEATTAASSALIDLGLPREEPS